MEEIQITTTAVYAWWIFVFGVWYNTTILKRSAATAIKVPIDADRETPWRKDRNLHKYSPNGQYPKCPSVVTIGTLRRQTRKSATERFVINMLVTVFMCGRRIVSITSRFPPTPTIKITEYANKRSKASASGSLYPVKESSVVQFKGKEAFERVEQLSGDILETFHRKLQVEWFVECATNNLHPL